MSTSTKVQARMAQDAGATAAASASAVQRVDESLVATAAGSADSAPLASTSTFQASDTGSGTPQPNEAPVVVDEWITVTAGQPVSAHQSALLGNDRDNDGGTLSITEFGNPAHGTLTRAADGTLTYLANANYSGADSFTYKVSDGQGGFTTGTVHITVESCTPPTNKPPVVVDEWANVRGTTAVSAHQSVLLANDSDPEGGALTIRNIGKPAHGTLTRAADGTLTYQANAGFTGVDSFTYEVVDPQGNFTTGTVHLCVLPATLSVTITDVRDDVGAVQGTVVDEGRTDDRRPALQGNTEANATVDIYDGTTKIGQVKADANGHWSFTPTADLGDGRHDFKAVATAIDGLTAMSNEWSVTVDCGTTPPPPPPPLPAPVVAIGEDLNNDGLINRAENTGRADAVVTLSAGAKAGDTLFVTDQSGARQEKVLTAADVAAGKVSFVDGFAMPADGQTLTLTAQIRSSEGVLSQTSTDSALLDTTAPGNPVITIVTDGDNNGRINQAELNNAGGIDLRVDLPDTAKVGDKLTVVDQAGHKIEVILTAAQIAAKAVNFDNAVPAPPLGQTLTVTATLTDPAGNVSLPSTDSAQMENPPSQVLAVSSPQATEGQALVFTVSTSASALDTTMTLNLASGTAVVGTDTADNLQVNFGNGWINLVGNQVLVPAGTTSYQVQVGTIDDKNIEPQETVSLTVSSGTLHSQTGVGTILDNDVFQGTARGLEDTPLTLTWANFNTAALPGAQGKIQVTTLPGDGRLEFNNNGVWTAVSAGQTINKSDIDAGKLRFTPDSHESGSDAYKSTGLGNKLNDYASVGFTAFDANHQALQGNKLTIDIDPVVDMFCYPHAVRSNSLTVSTEGLPPGNWQQFTMQIKEGSSVMSTLDLDGSERYRFEIDAGGASVAVVINGRAQLVAPDANGHYWVTPAAEGYFMHKLTVLSTVSKISYSTWREEVNTFGDILAAKKLGPYNSSSPLVLDLDGDGVQTVGLEQGVSFDLNANGHREQAGWTDGKDGLLVWDRNHDGKITSGAELFGEYTDSGNGQLAKDGFAALSALDSNQDGRFDHSDALWSQVQIWVDENLDGVSQSQELKGLDWHGVSSINLSATDGKEVQHGNHLGLVGQYTKADGSQGAVADVWFQVSADDPPEASLNAKDVLASHEAVPEVCSGDPAPCMVARAPEAGAQLASHMAMSSRATFERWEEHSLAMH